MNNQYRSIIVVVRLKHHSALVIIIVGVNIRGLSYTKLKQNKKLGLLEKFGLRRIDQEKNKRQEKKKSNERESSNSLPQECSDVFWLHMRKERTHESLSRFFFSFFPFPFFPPPIRSFDLSKGLVRWSRFFSFLFVRLGSGGSYRRHIYINDNLGHCVCVCMRHA